MEIARLLARRDRMVLTPEEARENEDEPRDMHARWPFLRALLSSMDMVLGKSDMGIASRQAELVPDATLRERIFGAIRAEWQRTVHHLLAINGIAAGLRNSG